MEDKRITIARNEDFLNCMVQNQKHDTLFMETPF
jgi:hypothetical protein